MSDQPPETASPEIKPDAGKGKQVLVIDDDPTTLELIKGLLTKYAFDVVTATNGKEGWSKITPTHPHIIIADVMMPEMDGFSFFKELRKNPESESIPIVMLTSRKNMEESFLALGANGFIAKPIDTNKLLTLIATIAKTAVRKPPAAPATEEKPKE